MSRLLALAGLVALMACPRIAAAPLGDFVAGTAVASGGPQDGKDPHVASGGLVSGSCGYGELNQQEWPFWSVVAVSPSHPLAANASRHPLAGCGACVELVCDPRQGFEGRCPDAGTAPSLVALITDTCMDCGATKMTLHYLAFQQRLASPDQGEVGIRWRQVECPAPGGIAAAIDTYRATAGGYLRLALRNVAGSGGVQAVELRRSPLAGDRLSLAGTAWAKMSNSWGAVWELSGLPDPPLDLRITSDSGEALVAREAITQAGATGRIALPVQFSTSGAAGTAEGLTVGSIAPGAAPACNDTVLAFLRRRPDLSTLLQLLEKAGTWQCIAPLLNDSSAAITLFAPTNEAWGQAAVARLDLGDLEVLQQVLAFLVAQGQVAVPSASQLLPEDVAGGGVGIDVDTLNGATLHVVASTGGITVRDGSPLTPDAIVVSANNLVCSSVVNVMAAGVPLPFA